MRQVFFLWKTHLSIEQTIFNEDELEDGWNAHEDQSKIENWTGFTTLFINKAFPFDTN